MTSKQQFLPEKLSKFNSTLSSDLLIECQIKHIVRKILRAVFPCHHSLMGPCKITQYYDQATVGLDFKIQSVLSVYSERIAIQFVQKKIWSTLNLMLQENAPTWQCVEWEDKRTYVSLIHMATLTTIHWISLLRPSPLISQLWSCFHALLYQMPAINKLPTKCVEL